MNNLIKQSLKYSFGIVAGGIFVFVPDTFISKVHIFNFQDDCRLLTNKIILFCAMAILTYFILWIYYRKRYSITITGNNYKIKVEYGDIFKNKGKKIISFDECYITEVGDKTFQINPKSICGQFLTNYADNDIKHFIENEGPSPQRKLSDFNIKARYESGTLIPYEDYLLLAFAKLDKDGRGTMTRNEYLNCLSKLWDEIDKHYGQDDIFVPVLGSGVTRFDGDSPTQQQLVDMMIASYQLSMHKIKLPSTLHIVCAQKKDFSLNKIGQYI